MATTKEEALKDLRIKIDNKKVVLQKELDSIQTEANANPGIIDTPEFKQRLAQAKEDVQSAYDDEKFYQKEINKGSETSKQREIDCPVCGGGKKEQIVSNAPKAAKSAQSTERFTGSIPLQKVSDFFGSIGNLLKAVTSKDKTKTVQSLFEGGKCPECGNKNKIKDPTDRTKQIEAAAKEAEAIQQEVLEAEAQMGPPGGNDYKLIVGDRVVEVGLGYNDTQSYTVLENAGLALGGGKAEKDGTVAIYEKVNVVVGTNPLCTPGGKYVIKCANSFKVRAGCQGIELNTEGPLIINAGQTKFVAPEITIGTSTGQVAIEGNNLSLAGKNVVVNAGADGNGQISFNGTVFATGNINAQGGAHFEGDVSCNSMTMPGKITRSQISSQDTQVTGAAVWRNEAASQALKDFLRTQQMRANDLKSGTGVCERNKKNIAAEQKELLKKSLPFEPLPCGFANLTTGEVFLFTHHHTLADFMHAHDSFGPLINTTPDSQTMRGSIAGSKFLAAAAPANHPTASTADSVSTTIRNLPIIKNVFA